MWDKFHLYSLVASLVLYLADLVTDVYVAVQYRKNGDELWFVMTVFTLILSAVLVNIHATARLNASCKVRVLDCLTHFSMIHLFIGEICRRKKESDGDKAYPCGSRKHFSECDCDTCKKQLEESVRASLDMSYVRSVEAFTEDMPQSTLQVFAMFYKQSYPWYAVLSVALSFLSLLVSIYSFEKNYWILEIVIRNKNYIRPVNFPKRSAVVFVVWQTLRLLGRLSAFVGLSIASSSLTLAYYGVRWLFDVSVCLCMSIISLLTIYPLFFHVSNSYYVIMRNSTPRDIRCSNGFALIGMAFLFLIFHGLGGNKAITGEKKDELLGWYVAILVVNALAFVFQAIFYSSKCHPLKVTYRKWKKLQDRAGVGRMGILTCHETNTKTNVPIHSAD
ncbi:XK-related 6 [Paramuricea clavata]|uniref:XK-related protein n=1 Tax=Paramuricea clavata TaxID=317549 RepID=A0A6S7JJ65_PARCT|nr:XK-related 6 [Paramuricea clavata]